MAHAADHLGGSLEPGGGDGGGGGGGDGEAQAVEYLATAQGVMLTFASVRSCSNHYHSCFVTSLHFSHHVQMRQ